MSSPSLIRMQDYRRRLSLFIEEQANRLKSTDTSPGFTNWLALARPTMSTWYSRPRGCATWRVEGRRPDEPKVLLSSTEFDSVKTIASAFGDSSKSRQGRLKSTGTGHGCTDDACVDARPGSSPSLTEMD